MYRNRHQRNIVPRRLNSSFRFIAPRATYILAFALLFLALSHSSTSTTPFANDDGAASDIIITRRVWLLWIMDIPTITMRTRPLFLSAQMQDTDAPASKRM